MMQDVLGQPIHTLVQAVRSGAVTAEAVANASLGAIRKQGHLNAFVHTCEESVMRTATEIDRKRNRGEQLGQLAGVPIGIKDAICTLDAPTTCGSLAVTL
jgi:aspartyl-tRNA(Asn)/glutamyl-tRNA(Gln) amidotransferase subunit A